MSYKLNIIIQAGFSKSADMCYIWVIIYKIEVGNEASQI